VTVRLLLVSGSLRAAASTDPAIRTPLTTAVAALVDHVTTARAEAIAAGGTR
jgi:hypothetical protein